MNRFACCLFGCLLLGAGGAAVGASGHTLVVCDSEQGPATLDPHRQFAEKNHTICQQIYEGLVRFGPEGNVVPALAVSWERRGPLTVRFHLREDVRFHNGEPFNAEAVRFSIERYFDPEIDFPAVEFLNSIDRVEVVDEDTVEVVTKFPDGLLLNRLAGFVLIVPPEHLRERGAQALDEAPVGTGPFRFEQWEKEKAIRLSANPEYWMDGRPKLDRLTFRFAPADQQVKLLLDGEVGLVTELPGTMTTRVEAAGRTRVVKQQTFWTVGATLNTKNAALSDVRVRRALNMAIDREDLVRYDSRGNGRVLASLTIPGEGGHNPELEPYPYDPERARELLEEAGVQTPLRLRTQVRAEAERTARILAAQLRDIGVELDIQTIGSDAAAARALSPERYDVGIGGGPDPMCHSFFRQSILLYSKSPFALVNDQEFDRRLVQMVQTLEPEERDRLARELDRYVHEQALSLFTYQRIKTYGKRTGVRFTPYISGMPYFFNTSVEPTTEGESAAASPDAARSDASGPAGLVPTP